MFSSFFYWSGVIFWIVLAVPAIWLMKVAGKDAYQCAVFTIRRVRHLPHGGFKQELPLIRTALHYWFFIWWGSYSRPPYVYHKETDTIVWFPGKESPETVYEEFHAPKEIK